ncbi:PTPA-CTERM sorting domain-containing protein [Phormidesmis priestleyi]
MPTPALLPGLIGLGMGVLRKRKAEATVDSEA